MLLGCTTLHRYPYEPVQVPEFSGQGAGIAEHNLIVRVTQFISHNQLLWLIQSNTDEFINSALDRVTSLSNTRFATYACQFLVHVIFVRTDEATENPAR